MQTFLSLRLQAALVAILFVGSIGALVFNVFSALVPRERELQVREQLREVSQKMAVAAAASWPSLRELETRRPEEVDRRLVEIGTEAMAAYPDVEGGFYLNGSVDRFSGFAQGSAKRPPPDRRVRNEPPPMESPLIRVQAQQSLDLAPGQFLLNIRDVGPSRVAVLTEPVGDERPASLATWVMFRLVDPKDIGVQLLRYQLSIGLAFAGLASAVLLAWNMGRMIRRQNIEQSRLQQELRRSEHLAALGTLLAGVAHEVRNPLAAIRSTVQLWQRLPDTAQNPSSLTAVVRAVDRINEIVTQLLQFSRTSGDERETVDVRQLLDETLNLVSANAYEQSVAIERHFDSHPTMISASGQALRQVFLNLATNALQAMPNGGTLHCRETRKDRTVEITFADTGPGVSVEDRAHLFEPFFTTRADGTGLGLAICREIITQHDGHIELVSDNSPGATFRIVLPVDHQTPHNDPEQLMPEPKRRELIVVADDDATIRANLSLLLREEGYEVHEAADGREALKALKEVRVALALLDLKMPHVDGMQVLREHAARMEETPIIVITALGGSAAAIEAMKLGAYDYITKPFDLDEVLFTVQRALSQRALAAQVQVLQSDVLEREAASTEGILVGEHPSMLQVFKLIGRVANTDENVLVLGESGTGKELVAAAIHTNSARADKPFVKINCAALSPTLLESELFGHERGAFTGAVARRAGRFEQANGGTLLLDEIGDLDIGLQAKLLRVLQTGQFERVGGDETLNCNVRVISATHRDLAQMIADRQFREDLFYRLNVVTIELPPLRARREDIPLLAEHFVRRLARKYDWPHLTLAPESVDWLGQQPWPGNVRQMQNVLARASTMAGGSVVLLDHLSPTQETTISHESDVIASGGTLREIVAATERRVIAQALKQADWNRTRAAQALGISRRQLFDKIHQYRLEPS